MKMSPAYIPRLVYEQFGAYQILPAVYFKEYRGQPAAFKTAPNQHPLAYRGVMRNGLFQQSIAPRPSMSSSVVSSNIPVKDVYGLQGYSYGGYQTMGGFGETSSDAKSTTWDDIVSMAQNMVAVIDERTIRALYDRYATQFAELMKIQNEYNAIDSQINRLLMTSAFSNVGWDTVEDMVLSYSEKKKKYETQAAIEEARNWLLGIYEHTGFSSIPSSKREFLIRFLGIGELSGYGFGVDPVATPAAAGTGILGVAFALLLMAIAAAIVLWSVYAIGRGIIRGFIGIVSPSTLITPEQKAAIETSKKRAESLESMAKSSAAITAMIEQAYKDGELSEAEYKAIMAAIKAVQKQAEEANKQAEKNKNDSKEDKGWPEWLVAVLVGAGILVTYRIMIGEKPIMETVGAAVKSVGGYVPKKRTPEQKHREKVEAKRREIELAKLTQEEATVKTGAIEAQELGVPRSILDIPE
jgi:hypothetical protein